MTRKFMTLAMLLAVGLVLGSASCSWGPTQESGQGSQVVPVQESGAGQLAQPRDTLIVASLNLAHGRRDALNQMLVSAEDTRVNLTELAGYFRRTEVDVVAVQEADAASRWSGEFDHLQLVAQEAGYPWFALTSHMQGWLANYGTGVLSRLPMQSASGLTFAPSPPTTRKGFTLAQVLWQRPGEASAIAVDVVSVHLDFSRKSVREAQLAELQGVLAGRSNPLVLMGDFNSESLAKHMTQVSGGRRLHAWENGEPTYKDKRLDWILLSPELQFVRYVTAQEILSDHRPVAAEIRLREQVQH